MVKVCYALLYMLEPPSLYKGSFGEDNLGL